MKKITLVAALVGVSYFSNAQVGIGTSSPAESAQLEIKAEDKGVLIPRVELVSLTAFSVKIKDTSKAIASLQEESLLVYNTATITAEKLTPGFYYWVKNGVTTPHWERIVNQTQLDEVINNFGDDVTKVKALLDFVYPSNALGTSTLKDGSKGGGMIFTPADGTTPAKIEYVYFDGTTYKKQDLTGILNDLITPEDGNVIYNSSTKVFSYWDGTKYVDIDLEELVTANESKTTLLEYPANSGKFYYISEATIEANNRVVPTSPFSTGTTLRPGVVYLDVPASVIKNFKTILDGTTTIVKPGTTNEYFTVEEYIQYLSSTVAGNVIYKNIATAGDPDNFVFQYWDGTKYETINLGDIVKANETKTKIVTIENKQFYLAENFIGAVPTTIPTTLPAGMYAIDVIGGIVNNFNELVKNNKVVVGGKTYNSVEEYIQYLSETSDANVGYTVTAIVAGDNGGVAIPANSLYYINQAGNKVVIDFGSIVKANETKTFFRKITNATNENAQYLYFSEEAIQTWLAADSANTVANIPNSAASITIDAAGDVVNNFESILKQTTVYKGDTVTIEKIINEIAGKVDGNVIYKNIAAAGDPANWVFQYWDGTEYKTINLGDIVKANETRTTLKRSENGVAYAEVMTDPKAATKITYEYSPERGDKNYIDVTADMIYSITNNKDVQNAITKILNDGGNVYYTETVINAADNHGTDVPAKSLFVIKTVGANQVKTPIDISGTVLQVITNNTQDVKNILGDNFNSAITIVNTGDTWIDGNKIYRGVFDSAVVAKTANVSPITLTGTVGSIIDIKILNKKTNQLINTTTTDVKVEKSVLEFKIGTGNMYVVLPEAADTTTNFEIKVIVEYSANITTP